MGSNGDDDDDDDDDAEDENDDADDEEDKDADQDDNDDWDDDEDDESGEEDKSNAGTAGAQASTRTVIFRGEAPSGKAEAATVVIHEVADPDFGLFLWPSGEVLAHFLWYHRRHRRHRQLGLAPSHPGCEGGDSGGQPGNSPGGDPGGNDSHYGCVSGCRVLEIGAGVALPGLLAARLGARRVVLTDRADGHATLANINRAVASNSIFSRAGSGGGSGEGGNGDDNGGNGDDNGGGGCTSSMPRPEEAATASSTAAATSAGTAEEAAGAAARLRLLAGDSCPIEVRGLSWGCFDAEARGVLSGLSAAEAEVPPGVGGGGSSSGGGYGGGDDGDSSSAVQGNGEGDGDDDCGGFDVVLGADCFYSSESFDDVLATVHWVLHAPLPRGSLGPGAAQQPLDDCGSENGGGDDGGEFGREATCEGSSAKRQRTSAPRSSVPKRRFLATYQVRRPGPREPDTPPFMFARLRLPPFRSVLAA